MSSRVREAHLKSLVEYLNQQAGHGKDPKYSTIGAYCLDFAHGGVSLHRYVNESGAIKDVLGCCHVPKKELYSLIHAYMRGMDDTKEAAQ